MFVMSIVLVWKNLRHNCNYSDRKGDNSAVRFENKKFKLLNLFMSHGFFVKLDPLAFSYLFVNFVRLVHLAQTLHTLWCALTSCVCVLTS
jgi:hypothetical protein